MLVFEKGVFKVENNEGESVAGGSGSENGSKGKWNTGHDTGRYQYEIRCVRYGECFESFHSEEKIVRD